MPGGVTYPLFQWPLEEDVGADSWLYLLVLLVAERMAAAPVSMAVLQTWASACLSGTVTSHASGLPLDLDYYY